MNAAPHNARPSLLTPSDAAQPHAPNEWPSSALSALVDGELCSDEEWAQCLADEADGLAGDEAEARWARYQIIGDVLRGTPDALPSRPAGDFLAGVRGRLATEAPHAAAVPVAGAPVRVAVPEPMRDAAANDPVFRWKLMAAAASLAAVMAVSWSVLGTAPGAPGGVSGGGQLALLGGGVPASATATAPVRDSVAQVAFPEASPAAMPGQAVVVNTPQGPVIRDAQLEERLAEHRRYGGMSALQMPAGFLRNATYDAPER